MKFLLPTVFLISLALCGCAAPTRKYESDQLIGKISAGMNEVQVTEILGPPSSIDILDDGRRQLRYEGTDGGVLVVRLKENYVLDAKWLAKD